MLQFVIQFSRRDDLQTDTGFDRSGRRLKIVELFGPIFLKLREARQNEAFNFIQ